MSQPEHYYFLLKIAKAIHELTVSAKAKAEFDARMKKFEKMFLDWSTAMGQAQKDAEANPRLKRCPRSKKTKPLPKGYIWDHYAGFGRSKDCPPNPIAWFWNKDISSEQREPTLDEILTCDYFCLAVIHDGALQGGRHIYFNCTEGGVWTDDTGASGQIPSEARLWWQYISDWGQDKETFWYPAIRVQIENALSDVEADMRKDLAIDKSSYTPERKRKSKKEKMVAIALHLEKRPNDTSEQVEKATGINASDVRRLWKPIKKAQKEGKRVKSVGKKHNGKIEAVDETASCKTCQIPLSYSFECIICNDIIKGECKTCHFTNEHPEEAEP